MPLNVELLQKVKAAILEDPRRLDMCEWVSEHPDPEMCTTEVHWLAEDQIPPCGTVACIAGWAAVLAGHRLFSLDAVRAALVGDDGYAPLNDLFYVGHWPYDLAERYANAEAGGDRAGMAAAAAERIDRFVAEHGRAS